MEHSFYIRSLYRTTEYRKMPFPLFHFILNKKKKSRACNEINFATIFTVDAIAPIFPHFRRLTLKYIIIFIYSPFGPLIHEFRISTIASSTLNLILRNDIAKKIHSSTLHYERNKIGINTVSRVLTMHNIFEHITDSDPYRMICVDKELIN